MWPSGLVLPLPLLSTASDILTWFELVERGPHLKSTSALITSSRFAGVMIASDLASSSPLLTD